MIADTFKDGPAKKPDPELEEPEWAMLEIMGHRTHAGMIVQVERFGTSLCEVREYGTEDKEPYRVHQYGGSSIFSITPCTEQYAREACDRKWEYERGEQARPLLSHVRDDDEFDPDDDQPF